MCFMIDITKDIKETILKTSGKDCQIWLLSNAKNISINQIGSFFECEYTDGDDPIFGITLTKKNASELIVLLKKWIDNKLCVN